MFGRAWCAAIAIGLSVAVWGVLAQERVEPALENQPIPDTGQQSPTEHGQAEASQEEPETDRLVPSLEAIKGAIRDLIAEEDAIERDRQEQREIADLEAQQDMALWAKLMFIATAFTVSLTFVGVLLIWRTLIHTRRAAEAAAGGTKAAIDAAKAAQITADAAITGNQLSRDAFIADQRAWLGADIKITSPITWTDEFANLTVAITVQNHGKTPAHHVMIHAYMAGFSVDDMKKINDLLEKAFIDGPDKAQSTTIFPGKSLQQARHLRCRMSPDQAANLWVYIRGSIIYDLSFSGERRRTIFNLGVARKGRDKPISPELGDIPTDELAFYMVGPPIVAE